jgi:ATP-dependent RNA helicase RhlE
MPPDIAKLAAECLKDPVRIDISPAKVAVDRIDQRVYHVPAQAKRMLLAELLADPGMDRVLVFTRTKRGADRVCKWLRQAGYPADALHGDKAQNARIRALDAFRDGRTRILVATDIAARGIDVPSISHVINYELPNEPESYVHRIGRTARAGTGGSAVAFCDQSERPHLKAIEALMRRPVAVASHRFAGAESKANGHRSEPRPSEQRSPMRRPEPAAKSPAKPTWVSRGRRGAALPAARGALTRPRAARLSLSGEAR